MLACALVAQDMPQSAFGQQFASAGPAQAQGLLNQLGGIGENTPGWLYYGINAADRGLGYRGSYMTLGGYIPYAQDDLGGLWAADLRSHLSVYGGFFSNVGLVRKQFIGGTILGVGVFWDYDGDQNQYSDTTIVDTDAVGQTRSYVFAGGETYQQVGVSGEWLTDWGNIRSNGYIPTTSTPSVMGPFVGNSILCVNGINAALGGTDLEVGAYVPGLSDWAGMISVGGYAYGNAKDSFPNGTAIVPWFGGVYTRLDMTFLENWDFSLQANNDSYFDWTGFARLTYRMGGSRRRNVPDQMEQPMMRNEHIVRAHQAPVQAINPVTNDPWRIIHVDNSSSVTGSGEGTYENPFKTLRDGRDAATQQYDVVFLHRGISNQIPYSIPVPPADPLLNPSPAASSYFFQADNQYLVGEGSSLKLNTVSCGPIPIWNGSDSSAYPVISNAGGTAVVLTDPAGTVTNAVVDHVEITDSRVGISDGPNGLPTNGLASVNDVRIIGTGASQRGVEITAPGTGLSTFNFTNMRLDALTDHGFHVRPSSAGLGTPQVNILDTSITNTGGSGIYVENLLGPVGRVWAERVSIDTSTRSGVDVRDGNLTFYRSAVRNAGIAGLSATDNSTVQVVQSVFFNNDIGVQATANTGRLNITITDCLITPTRVGNGIVLATPSPITGAEIYASVIGNEIVSANSVSQDIVLFDGSPSGPQGSADLWIEAANEANLRVINADATIVNVFPDDTLSPGTPPPPNYDPSLVVPLPPQ
jgi:hypothetical protein